MGYTSTALSLILFAYSGTALAGHGNRGGYYGAQHDWARYYADTAIAQVRQNRERHCNYYGQRWSGDYYDHYNWALRVPRGQAQSEINRRDRDLRHCVSRHGGYHGHHGHDCRHFRRDHGHGWGRHGWLDHGHDRRRDRRHDHERHDRGGRDRHDRLGDHRGG